MLLLFAAILIGRRLFQLQLPVRIRLVAALLIEIPVAEERAGVGARQHCAQAP